MFISVPISDSIEGDKGRLLEINLFHLKSLLDFKLRIIPLLLINCIFYLRLYWAAGWLSEHV